jgi:hypothetical protein
LVGNALFELLVEFNDLFCPLPGRRSARILAGKFSSGEGD